MDDTRAAQIRARVQAATPGPWHSWNRGIGYEVHVGSAPAYRECRLCPELNDEFRETFRGPDADLIAHAPADLSDLLAERDRMGHELAWWAERFPCDGMCSPNDGPQEDCSRHGRAPKDLWGIITRLTAENNAMRAVVEAYERWTGDPDGWAEMAAAVRAYRATTGEAGR